MHALACQWGEDLFAGEMAHRAEHTVEFQVIFLQHLFGPEVRIVPLLCSFSPTEVIGDGPVRESVDRFAAALTQVAGTFAGRVIMLASADLSHVGPRYGDPWAADGSRLALVHSHDQDLIQLLLSGDAEGMAPSLAAAGNRFRVCGFPPIYTLMRALQVRGGVLLDYRHALMDGNGSVVTFASLALY